MKRTAVLALILQSVFVTAGLGEDSIWTSKPVRVDPARQNFERLPEKVMGVEGGEPVSFPIKIEMHDSASFSANGAEFILKDLKGLAANRLCRSETGMRWSCGSEARAFVGNLFRGRTLICKVERQPGKVLLSRCRNNRLDIPSEIIARGFAFPNAENGELEPALMKAKAHAQGVWKDVACLGAHWSC